MELMIPYEMNNRKMERYGSLVADLRSARYKEQLSCVKIESRALISNDNGTRIFKFVGSKAHQLFFRDMAKNEALMCSYTLALLCGIANTGLFC